MAKFQGNMKIISKKELVKDVYEMVLSGEGAAYISVPGQFINIRLHDSVQPYLRRPMSICDYTQNSITIIFKVVGEGTKILAAKQIGEVLDCLIGLGNGFTLQTEGKALLVGGGLGVPPLYYVGKKLKEQGIEVTTILGFGTSNDVFYAEQFATFGNVFVSTIDGSMGTKGTVIDVMQEQDLVFDQYYSCGPEPMLHALAASYADNGQLSFEARMGCGFGACMGCSCKVITAPYKRICVEGPILYANEVIVNG